jgi:hypothetical protein
VGEGGAIPVTFRHTDHNLTDFRRQQSVVIRDEVS